MSASLPIPRLWPLRAGRQLGLVMGGVLGLGLLWLSGLALSPLFDVDEGAFAEASREMLAHGDWGHTTLNGVDRWDKPILVYWLQAVCMAGLGPGEVAVRLPSALCAWLWCLATAAFVAPRWGWKCAILAAGMLASSLGPALIGRAATADALLNLLLSLTLFDIARALERPQDAAPRLRCSVWIGLGLLAKGPVALVLPAAALLVWVLLAPQRGQAWERARHLLTDARAWALLLAVALPWYLYAVARHGQAFIEGFLFRHNVERFTGPLEGHGGSLFYYVIMLPLLTLPWALWLWPVLRNVRSACASDHTRWLLAWAGFVLVFFSLSGTKLPHYALYGITPVLILAAQQGLRSGRRGALAIVLTSYASWVLALSVPVLVGAMARRWGDAHWVERFSQELPAFAQPGWTIVGGLTLLVLGAAAWQARATATRTAALLLAATLSTAGWVWVALPWLGQTLQGPVKALALEAREQGWTLVQWQLNQPSAGYYRAAPVLQKEPGPGEVVLMRSDRYASLPPGMKQGLVEVRRKGGFVLLRAP